MQKTLITLGAIGLILIMGFLSWSVFYNKTNDPNTESPKPVAVCTLEAKICPDGSAVGRSGPACEFTACPEVVENNASSTTSATSSQSTTTKPIQSNDVVINQKFTNNGISIIPLEIVEDSRCPLGVFCIQAGTVRLKVNLQSATVKKEVVLTLEKPVLFSNKKITLTGVQPIVRMNESRESRHYIFNFSVTNATDTLVFGTLSGVMTIGPVCPVQKIDNPCFPFAEMFAAQPLLVFSEIQKVLTQMATLTPDRLGKFSIDLPVGNYYIRLAQNHTGPGGVTGLPLSINITEGSTTNINVAIDTGIR